MTELGFLERLVCSTKVLGLQFPAMILTCLTCIGTGIFEVDLTESCSTRFPTATLFFGNALVRSFFARPGLASKEPCDCDASMR